VTKGKQVEATGFLKRVIERVPTRPVTEYTFSQWNAGGATNEGFGLLPVSGADPERVLGCVMDVDHYVPNVRFVEACRSIPDARFEVPRQVRFYQRVKIPLLGAVHHELVLERVGAHLDYEIAVWHLLDAETDALDGRSGIRSAVNEGAWLVAPGVVGYALCSTPRKEDVGFLKWKAMTKGANAGASAVLKDAITGMASWAARVG